MDFKTAQLLIASDEAHGPALCSICMEAYPSEINLSISYAPILHNTSPALAESSFGYRNRQQLSPGALKITIHTQQRQRASRSIEWTAARTAEIAPSIIAYNLKPVTQLKRNTA
ncbi:hypothetical protein Nepgr_008064 [Nepenthes gracilis]|uniref:Uncharacterized protein n=1 Tax=Nepenthes gracilis TaxID=150966 RepID=A0AAD3XIX4_NEPGR|nr:hypothetical protein Nepgr_008064 [Nepenthes gracilis]